jgi:hypothetical protein
MHGFCLWDRDIPVWRSERTDGRAVVCSAHLGWWDANYVLAVVINSLTMALCVLCTGTWGDANYVLACCRCISTNHGAMRFVYRYVTRCELCVSCRDNFSNQLRISCTGTWWDANYVLAVVIISLTVALCVLCTGTWWDAYRRRRNQGF